jgi:hypothetical protein
MKINKSRNLEEANVEHLEHIKVYIIILIIILIIIIIIIIKMLIIIIAKIKITFIINYSSRKMK